jgi:two-component system chemotaxis response regulator CheB
MNPSERKVIRVLVVEDSRVVAEFLTHLLCSDPGIRVVGVAADGEEAVAAAQRLRPDVITMDLCLPKANGFEATRRIMETCPAPIVIVSGSISIGGGAVDLAANFRALEAGALAVVARPNGIGRPQHEAMSKELVDAVRLMSEVKVVKRWPRSKGAFRAGAVAEPAAQKLPSSIHVVAIGASTGGPLAVQAILSGLPRGFPLPVLIAQHMTPGFAPGFAEWLARSSHLAIRIAADGEPLLPGHAYIAPDDFHMGVRSGHRILLMKAGKDNGARPSVAFLFRSVEQVFGANAVGVLLTGMGKDGAEELKRLKDRGAVTIAQDEDSSVVHGMPGEAIQIGAALHVLPPAAIANVLAKVVTQP